MFSRKKKRKDREKKVLYEREKKLKVYASTVPTEGEVGDGRKEKKLLSDTRKKR